MLPLEARHFLCKIFEGREAARRQYDMAIAEIGSAAFGTTSET
tara:strand:- start:278 stop:406 length:129 start_codon:yes stop_codon:yes gene_type:complete